MKTLQNNYTTPEQSKRLLELGVPADSADCWYNSTNEHGNVTWFHMGIRYCMPDFPDWSKTYMIGGCFGKKVPYYLPCWSVGRLFEIIAICLPAEIIISTDECPHVLDNILHVIEDCIDELDFSKLEE